jgi:hypothetical protein
VRSRVGYGWIWLVNYIYIYIYNITLWIQQPSAHPAEDAMGGGEKRGLAVPSQEVFGSRGNDMAMLVNCGFRYTQTDLPHLRGLTSKTTSF